MRRSCFTVQRLETSFISPFAYQLYITAAEKTRRIGFLLFLTSLQGSTLKVGELFWTSIKLQYGRHTFQVKNSIYTAKATNRVTTALSVESHILVCSCHHLRVPARPLPKASWWSVPESASW